MKTTDDLTTNLDFYIKGVDANELIHACTQARPDDGQHDLLLRINNTVKDLEFQHVLSRSGWHRPGGIVDRNGKRITNNLRIWAEQESDGDILALLDKYADRGWFATRLLGATHYLVATTGSGSTDFIQLEVEELQEVLARPLFDPDWYPESLEEFVEPIDFPELEPEPVGDPRYLFRRAIPIAKTLEELREEGIGSRRMRRFLRDWNKSSAVMNGYLWNHWVIRFIPYTDRYGDRKFNLKPLTTYKDMVPDVDGALIQRGAGLANLIREIDRQAGYPMAWYFFMLTTPGIKHEIAWSVMEDHSAGFDYLPERDLEVIQSWCDDPYSI
ncbi:hypothetical protein MNBD_GAMMA24-1227 [hydrothermal vent metagenome]|uniref:Uncharacterized protein n=1 Tax=hydrothermal vent metagenome TaxID=652676 RepID=A0A3B1BDD1_9ZZZZ